MDEIEKEAFIAIKYLLEKILISSTEIKPIFGLLCNP